MLVARKGNVRRLPWRLIVSAYRRAKNFPEIVRFRAEPGLTGAIVGAARQQRTSAGEYLRRALRAQLVADGVNLPPLDGPDDHTPAPAAAARIAA